MAAEWDDNPVRRELASAVAEAIITTISLDKKWSVLDYGCGTAMVSAILSKKVKGCGYAVLAWKKDIQMAFQQFCQLWKLIDLLVWKDFLQANLVTLQKMRKSRRPPGSLPRSQNPRLCHQPAKAKFR